MGVAGSLPPTSRRTAIAVLLAGHGPCLPLFLDQCRQLAGQRFPVLPDDPVVPLLIAHRSLDPWRCLWLHGRSIVETKRALPDPKAKVGS